MNTINGLLRTYIEYVRLIILGDSWLFTSKGIVFKLTF